MSAARAVRGEGAAMTAAGGHIGADAGRLVARGEIHAADMAWIHERAMAAAWPGGQTVVLDLSQVTGWSSVAQAMIVALARDLAEQRSRLVLSGASLGLRRQSQELDLFRKVRAICE